MFFPLSNKRVYIMQNNQFTIKASQLQAMSLLASKQDIRYYLNGVRVEFNSTTTRLIATDGHKLGLFNYDSTLNNGLGSLTIHNDFIASLPKVTKAQNDLLCTIWQDQNNPTLWHCVYGNNQTQFVEIEGRYPDYSRVIQPIKTSGQPGQFNDEYLAQFKKCGLLLTWLKKQHFFPEIIHNGNSSAIIQLPTLLDQFVGVIMPLKSDFIESAIVDPAIYAPLVQHVTVQNNGLVAVSDTVSEAMAA
jgi:DNA polymerase-3 subunit beta